MRPTLLLLLLITSALARAETAPLRFSAVDSWAMPVAQIESNELTGGIIFDIIQGLARQLGREAQINVLPRTRVQLALEHGDVDVRCYVSPNWMGDLGVNYLWSEPILVQRDLLVSAPDNASPVDPQRLPAQSVGTVLGYSYPGLQERFDDGTLQRDEARNQGLVLQKLGAGRYSYAVSSELALKWFNRGMPASERLAAVAVLEEEPVACLVRNAPEIPANEIVRALARMRTSGEIERIVSRYR
ncbi:substrate-binding periplasmic protein [Pseudomonas sp. TUM22785]|uniref:substrate-binding periplasmic protein n=1 Tax=Pseudomonas sp. TUM22785 TaxID=3019098 RepID=UPI0023063E72|nr:transporter substrate-binding domain-containing protein [Pseudomonas sp. TUM22785]WCD82689.1 transporter substrate-binding domain-containing protein [Pseudomonas sp. TUM22785]